MVKITSSLQQQAFAQDSNNPVCRTRFLFGDIIFRVPNTLSGRV